MNALAFARVALEDLLGRFEPFVADTPSLIDTCRALVESVRFDELHRPAGGSPLDTSCFRESDGESKVVGVRDRLTGRVVGCVRGTFVRSLLHLPAVRREYLLDQVPPELAQRAAIATRMVVEPNYRKTAASLVLMRTLYRIGLEDGLDLFAVSCEPALLPIYLRMGYRAVGPAWAKPDGGYRIPAFMAAYDLAHLTRVRSPLLPLLRSAPGPWPTEATRWLSEHCAQVTDLRMRAWRPTATHPALEPLVQGLSPAGRTALLTHAFQVDALPGDLIFRAGDGVRSLIALLEGRAEARLTDHTHPLTAGALLGLTSVLCNTDRRASVVATEPSRLLFFSRSALDRVRTPTDRARLWQNLARLAVTR